MPVDKSRLKTYLLQLPILTDEKRMWFRLGFYIQSPLQDYVKVHLVDAAANEIEISCPVAKNLRKTALEWWEVESVKPRYNEVDAAIRTDSFDQLETRRQG